MKTYSVKIKASGNVQQYVTVSAPDPLTAIDNVIGGLEVTPCYEYTASEVKNETVTLGS